MVEAGEHAKGPREWSRAEGARYFLKDFAVEIAGSDLELTESGVRPPQIEALEAFVASMGSTELGDRMRSVFVGLAPIGPPNAFASAPSKIGRYIALCGEVTEPIVLHTVLYDEA